MAAVDEKHDISRVERLGSDNDVSSNEGAYVANPGGFVTDLNNIPKGYYWSPSFLGTMFAVGIGLAAATGAFGLVAPILGIVNNDIGPDPNIVWVSLVYVVTMAIGLLMVGRLSDLFGRRYFFIGAACIGVLGSIVCATAKSVNALIGGMVLLGLASSGQQSFAFITGEIVPMKYRFAANGLIYLGCIPFSSMGPAVSQSVILHTTAGWRWCFYLMIIVNAISGLLFVFFYFPPTFYDKFQNSRTKMQQIKEFDYIGTVLFMGGFIIFLLGLSWGGSVYPWTSARVIAFMVVGGVTMIGFGLWECYAPLKEPLLPVHLFRSFAWVSSCINLGIGAAIYYAMAIIWPQVVGGIYADPLSMYAGYLNCIPGACIVVGMVSGGLLAEPIGKQKYQTIFAFCTGGALIAACACVTPDNMTTLAALLSIGIAFIGWNESVCLSCAGIELLDQKEIGTAVGAAGSIRSFVSSIANAVYLSVLANRLSQTIPEQVPPAVINAGLPADSVAPFIQGFTTGSFANITGLTPEIQAIGTRAYQEASASAYSTVFLATIAFTGIGIILAFFNPNVDDKMTGDIAVTLHHTDADAARAREVKETV